MESISLALSGGGIRAMVFHMGVLRRLAELGLMERVGALSSVSGGSLLVGLILHEAGMVWPSSRSYPGIHAALRGKLCGRSLMVDMARQLLQPRYLPLILYRANLLYKALKNDWGVTESLTALPDAPSFFFQGTTAETGRRFQFGKGTLGDYELGYADSGDLPLSYAMAVSAAFPGGLGPLLFHADRYTWKKPWTAAVGTSTSCPYAKLHLYDGGVYDNLGLEPFFDVGSNTPRRADAFILVSDAGAPFRRGFSYGALNPLRLKRTMDVMSEQTRALRVRSFCTYLNATRGGSYVWINTALRDPALDELRAFACAFPTTLRRLSETEFDRLERYGYLVATARIRVPDAWSNDAGAALEAETAPERAA